MYADTTSVMTKSLSFDVELWGSALVSKNYVFRRTYFYFQISTSGTNSDFSP